MHSEGLHFKSVLEVFPPYLLDEHECHVCPESYACNW